MSKPRVLIFALAVVASLSFLAGTASAVEPAAGCSLDVANLTALSVAPAALATPVPQGGSFAVDLGVPEPDFLVTFRGYCRCSCSRVKNCRTSADCGGSACLGGITCC